MAAAVIPLIQAGAVLEPVVVDLVKRAISLFHHTKQPAAPGAPATAAGTVPLSPAQAQATSAAAATTAQALIDTAVKNGVLPASAAPDAALIPVITQLLYSLMPVEPVAATPAIAPAKAVGAVAVSGSTEAISPEKQALINALVIAILGAGK